MLSASPPVVLEAFAGIGGSTLAPGWRRPFYTVVGNTPGR